MLGHSQPLVQSSQHAHSQLQFGQSLQQSFAQQLPALQVGSAALVAGSEWLTKPAAASAEATNSPPNTLANMNNSLSWML
jgi:hypothetical protein